MQADPGWKIGVEIETLAPRGRSRADLAHAVATAAGGQARRIFHPQSEPSLVPGQPVFENLTLGYLAEGPGRRPIARFVDDLTLQDDCDRSAPAAPGWWRVVGDDARWLRLCARYSDPEAELPRAIDRFCAILGVRPVAGPDGMWRIADGLGASIAIAAPLPGERERPCEIVTEPMTEGLQAGLERLLAPARALGFTIPAEGATHLHFDGAPFANARAMGRLIRLFAAISEPLRRHVHTNPRCRRLGPPSDAVLDVVRDPAFDGLPWSVAREQLREAGVVKYVDLNVRNVVLDVPRKRTIEVRILPVWLEAAPIVEAAHLFAGLLRLALSEAPLPDEPVDDAGLAALLR